MYTVTEFTIRETGDAGPYLVSLGSGVAFGYSAANAVAEWSASPKGSGKRGDRVSNLHGNCEGWSQKFVRFVL